MISIITVSCGNLTDLKTTLDSCITLFQTGIEIIVIDGSGIPLVSDYLQSLKILHKHIPIVFSSRKDSGIYDGMNRGLDLARGTHAIFMNSGDVFVNNGAIIDLCSSFSQGVLYYGNSLYHDNQSQFLKTFELRNAKSFMHHNSFCHQAVFYPREFYHANRYQWKKFPVSADFDFTLRCFLKCQALHLNIIVSDCELGGYSCQNPGRSYWDRVRSIKSNLGYSSAVLLLLYLPIFILKALLVGYFGDKPPISSMRRFKRKPGLTKPDS